jgi:hypothetical protein
VAFAKAPFDLIRDFSSDRADGFGAFHHSRRSRRLLQRKSLPELFALRQG